MPISSSRYRRAPSPSIYDIRNLYIRAGARKCGAQLDNC